MTPQAHFAKLFEILQQEIRRCVTNGEHRDDCFEKLEELKRVMLDALREPKNDSARRLP